MTWIAWMAQVRYVAWMAGVMKVRCMPWVTRCGVSKLLIKVL